MRILPATEVFIEGNQNAILLLHSYTSHTRDMKKLAAYLHEQGGYTCYAPLLKGHGTQPEALLQSEIEDWWQDAQHAYAFLQQKYDTISVIGLSIGGVLALKLAQHYLLDRLIIMSVPIDRTPETLKKRLLAYAMNYKKLEGKDEGSIAKELIPFEQSTLQPFQDFQQVILTTMQNLSAITAPTAIYYGKRDDQLYETSAQAIATKLSSAIKYVKAFPNASHLMTLGKEQEAIFKEIETFFMTK